MEPKIPKYLLNLLSKVSDERIWEALRECTCTEYDTYSLFGDDRPIRAREFGCTGFSCDECILVDSDDADDPELRKERLELFKQVFIEARRLRRNRESLDTESEDTE